MRLESLRPMLYTAQLQETVDFYTQILGFTCVERNDDWGWAMLCFDECRLMVDQSIYFHRGVPRESVLYLYPENIVEYHRQVRSSGLDVPDLDVTFYGMREFRLDDPDGNRLWIGQNTSTGA